MNYLLIFLRGSYMDKEYLIRPYENNDYSFVYDTKKTVYKKYVEECWGEWNEEKQRGFFVDFVNLYGKDIEIVLVDNKPVGFYHCAVLESGEFEIGNICIIPEYQGRGIGSKILHGLIDSNRDKDIVLQYFKQNPVGNLYRRLGFEFLEEKPYHIKMILKKK